MILWKHTRAGAFEAMATDVRRNFFMSGKLVNFQYTEVYQMIVEFFLFLTDHVTFVRFCFKLFTHFCPFRLFIPRVLEAL